MGNVNDSIKYGDCVVLDQDEVYLPKQSNNAGVSYIRVRIPCDSNRSSKLRQAGYYFADRTLKTSISLQNTHSDFSSLIHMQCDVSNSYGVQIINLARQCFVGDRRFWMDEFCEDEMTAFAIIDSCVKKLCDPFVCLYNERLIGFLFLGYKNDRAIIELAAVDQRYRLLGAALSLYSTAVKSCRDRGFAVLEGRISTKNVDVMNLYSYLGAMFLDPEDIYIYDNR